MFIVIDGIDGCGKGTILKTFENAFKKQGLKIFDLRKYWESFSCFPEYEDRDIRNADVIFCAEPTFGWIGETIREELIQKNDRNYSALSIAQAFALDREILYRRLLLKALKDKKIWVQERSFSTSIIYQQIQKDGLTLEELLALPGNKLATENPPDFLIVPKLSAETAIQRLSERSDKKDEAIFEKLSFLKIAAKEFYSDWFRKFFEELGTKVVYINTEGKIEKTKNQAEDFIKKNLK